MIDVPLDIVTIEELGYHLFVTVKLNGTPLQLVVDTGASQTVFNKELMDAFSIDYDARDGFSLGVGSSDLVSYSSKLELFEIGDLQIEHFAVAVMDLSGINEAYKTLGIPAVGGILGSDFFMEHRAIINYAEKKMLLSKTGTSS